MPLTNRSATSEVDSAASIEPNATDSRSLHLARRLLTGLFRDFQQSVAVRLWHGETFRVGLAPSDHATPEFNLAFRNAAVVCDLILSHDPLRIADAYFRGDVDIEGDFRSALVLRNHLQDIRFSWCNVPR